MGLFDAFKKKDCEICGKEVGMFGYKKLEDGEICKDCVKLLSPWFDDRRHSTVEQIKRQLAAREENYRKLQTWNHEMALGDYQKIYFNFVNGVPESFVICSSGNYKEDNADIIPLRQLSSFNADIQEDRRELMQENEQGEEVSYNPPRFEYSYEFYIEMMVSGIEYIDDMRIHLNRDTVELETVMPKATLFGVQPFDPMHYPEYRQYKAMMDEVCEILSCGQRGCVYSPQQPAAAPVQPMTSQAAAWTCESCGSRNTGKFCQGCGAPAPAPKVNSWKCFCGTVNTGKFCENCGTQQFTPDEIECSECSWRAEPGDVFTGICPSCDHKFGPEDLDM